MSLLRGLRTGTRHQLALLTAAVTFVLALTGLLITHEAPPVAGSR